jgi:Ca2+:H+ antiporter
LQAAIGLAIPPVIIVSLATGRSLMLGVDAVDTVILMLTLPISILSFSRQRTNVLLYCVHPVLFGACLMLIFDR